MDKRKAKKNFKKDLKSMRINVPNAKTARRANKKNGLLGKASSKFTNWL